MNYNEEKKFLMDFVAENADVLGAPTRGEDATEDEPLWGQLRSLWTAFCLHNHLEPDTAAYDTLAAELYDALCAALGVEDVPAPDGTTKDYDDGEDADIFGEFDLWLGAFLA